MSTGTITAMVSKASSKLDGVLESIWTRLIQSKLIHCDETCSRVDGKTIWVHNASNQDYTLLTLSTKRGKIGMEEGKVLPYYKGIVEHDCWSSYWFFDSATHAVCNAHLLRELIGIKENYPSQTWVQPFIDLLLDMKKTKERVIAREKENLSYYYLHKFDKRYIEIIETAKAENPLPEKAKGKRGRPKKGKVRTLIERLTEYKASVCLFIRNFIGPFDNNQVERDIQNVKVKTKVSGCFRTKECAEDYLRIMSYVGKARKLGFGSYESI